MTDFIRSIQTMKLENRGELNWIIAWGVLSVIAGCFALVFTGLASLAATLLIGAVLLVTGLSSIVVSYQIRKLHGFWSLLIFGILFSASGFFILSSPVLNMTMLTLLVGLVIGVNGVARILGCFFEDMDNKGLLFFNGVVSLLCSGIILSNWPVSGWWVLGTFLGVDFIISGMTTISYASTAKRIYFHRGAPAL